MNILKAVFFMASLSSPLAWGAEDLRRLEPSDWRELGQEVTKALQRCHRQDLSFVDFKNKTDESLDRKVLIEALNQQIKAAKLSQMPTPADLTPTAELSKTSKEFGANYQAEYIFKFEFVSEGRLVCNGQASLMKNGQLKPR